MNDRIAIVGAGAGRTALMLAMSSKQVVLVGNSLDSENDTYELTRMDKPDILNTVLTKKGLIFPDGNFNRRARREQKRRK